MREGQSFRRSSVGRPRSCMLPAPAPARPSANREELLRDFGCPQSQSCLPSKPTGRRTTARAYHALVNQLHVVVGAVTVAAHNGGWVGDTKIDNEKRMDRANEAVRSRDGLERRATQQALESSTRQARAHPHPALSKDLSVASAPLSRRLDATWVVICM